MNAVLSPVQNDGTLHQHKHVHTHPQDIRQTIKRKSIRINRKKQKTRQRFSQNNSANKQQTNNKWEKRTTVTTNKQAKT